MYPGDKNGIWHLQTNVLRKYRFGDACKTGIQVDDSGSILSEADDCIYEYYLKKCFLDVCYKGFSEYNKKTPQLTLLVKL